MTKPALLETDIGRAVVNWLQAQHWETYCEVQYEYAGRVADIVAVQGRLVWVIECKRSLGLSVIEQAAHWRYEAHLASVAVPDTKDRRSRSREFAHDVCHWLGIGVLRVGSRDYVSVARQPRLNRKAQPQWLRGCLVPQQRDSVPGSEAGGQWTPFKETCGRLRRFVKEHPGTTMKEAVSDLKHHYCNDVSAIGSLRKWIRQGKVPGVREEMDGRRLLLYPTDGEKEK
jgi:hypothetical protein